MRESNKKLLTGLDAENTDVEYSNLEGGDLRGLIMNPISRVRSAMKGQRNDYPPRVRKLRETIGGKDITSMSVFRRPISGAINTAMNVASMGDWSKLSKEKGFDAFYHLGLLINISGEGMYILEKNAVIEMRKVALHNMSKEGENRVVKLNPNQDLTTNILLNKAQKAVGDKFFHYDPFTNNCQVFVKNLLSASGLLTTELNDFIFQDISSIISKLNPLAQKLAPAITKIGSVADVAIEGEGFANYTDMSGKHSDMLDGGKLNFMDSFKPKQFKRSFNTAMDILSLPAKVVSTLVPGSGIVINPVVGHRMKHNGVAESAF